VTISIGKSEGLYSSFIKRLSKHNSGLLKVGVVEVDIPQHPVALHGMVARSSKRLSTTLQEFIRLPSSLKQRSVVLLQCWEILGFSSTLVTSISLSFASLGNLTCVFYVRLLLPI